MTKRRFFMNGIYGKTADDVVAWYRCGRACI